MANFSGQLVAFGLAADPTNRSTNVALLTYQAGLSLSVGSNLKAANQGTPQPAVSISHVDLAGQRIETFGGQLFEKVIVIPRVKALGFVLTATQFPVEVWNAFRDSDQTLVSITINGSGGLTLPNPYGVPLIFAALDSFIFQATVPSSGAAQIDQDVVFAFDSGISSDLHVTGSRITVFSVAPEWGEGMEETIEYLTDVLKAYSDAEQRRALRQRPRRAMRFRALTLNARDAAGMESLVWGWQNQPYGVPWWPDSQPLSSSVAVGSFTIPVATADRLFAAGGLLAIWVNEYTFEALSIASVASNSVTTTSPTQFAWTAGPGTRVVPLFLCRLPSSLDVSRFSSEMDQIDISFIAESGQPAPTPSTSPTQYKGFDVLEIMPNWANAPLKRRYQRSLVTVDPKIGPIEVVDKGGSAIVGQEFPWWVDGHSNITGFRAFMLRRFGRFNPFWIPTWDQDLVLFQDVASTDTAIRIKSVFYTRFLFPSPSRRYLALIPQDGSAKLYRQVTNAVDNGDGTETLTLDATPGKVLPKTSTMISFLTFARLGSDSISIKWDSTEHAESMVEIQEVPREIP